MHKNEAHTPPGVRVRDVLYVEDDPASLKLVEQVIARHPELRLLAAVNGKSGLEMAWVSRPEVIVMDINLPDISGFKALETLRADPATARIPVIALSSNDMPLNVESGMEAGFFRYLTKPIQVNMFMAALAAALDLAEESANRK